MNRPPSLIAICATCAVVGCFSSPVSADNSGLSEGAADIVSTVGATRAGFLETFERPLDPKRWFVSSGWSNGNHQNCLWHNSQVAVANGVLSLSLSDTAQGEHDYSCAEIQSEERYGYGTYEARMRIPFAPGVNANFFTHLGGHQKSPHNEIDFEFITNPGRGPALQTNFYTNDRGGNEAFHPVPGAEAEFHTYAFEWSVDALRWYIDGELIREQTGPGVPVPPQKIYLSIWSTDTLAQWMGRLEYPDEPLVLEAEWVAFTPAGSECQFEESAACRD